MALNMSRHRLSALLPLAIATVCSIAGAEVAPPQFRSATQTVPIYVTAVRNDGHLATGLTKSDFVVYEDGKETAIETFSSSTDSIALIAMFQTGYLRGRDQTTDDPQARAQTAGRALVTALWPGDRLRHGTFGNEIVFSPISASDKTVLRTIVDEETWVGHGYVAFWDAVSVGVRTIRQETQRRVLLVFGSGLDTARLGPGSAPEAVIDAALQSDVMIYGISLERRGLDASLRRAARETGGGVIEISPSADPSRAMADVVAELHSQYAIGIPSLADGRQHRITVATRTSGITLRARSSYVAAK